MLLFLASGSEPRCAGRGQGDGQDVAVVPHTECGSCVWLRYHGLPGVVQWKYRSSRAFLGIREHCFGLRAGSILLNFNQVMYKSMIGLSSLYY